MTIRVNCPDCGQEYRLSDSLAGKKAKCKACGGVVLIPADSADQLADFDQPAPARPAAKSPPKPPPLPTKSASAAPKPPPVPKTAAAPALPKIAVSCDMCFSDFQAKGELAGKKTKCPECGEMVTVPGGKPKPKAKPQPVEDEDDFADDVAFVDDDDEFEEDEPAPRKAAAKGKEKKKSGKRSRGAATEHFIDTIPIPALIGGMWTLIIIGCVLMVLFGKSTRNGAAIAGGDIFAPPDIPAATSGPATEPYNLAAIPVPPIPEPGPIQPGPSGAFVYTETQFAQQGTPGGTTRIRMRLPHGQHSAQSLGCILVGFAGTPLIFGTGLDEPDYFEESQPYIQAGYAVCEYSMDGEIDDEGDDATDAQILSAYQKFTAAYAGIVNVRNAIEFVTAKMPQINPNRIYIAGHSSAGTAALLAAAHEPRIKACMAYSPATDCLNRQKEMLAYGDYDKFTPNIREFLQRSSPMTHAARITCPVYLFTGTEDDVVDPNESRKLHTLLSQLGKPVTLETVPGEDHYETMTAQGLPKAIAWLKLQPSENSTPSVSQAAPMP